MTSIKTHAASFILMMAALPSTAMSQFGGSRAGIQNLEQQDQLGPGQIPVLKPEVAEAYITMEGTAELRVRPTQIRVVLAISSQAETAQMCRQEINDKVKLLRSEWKKLSIPDAKIVEDFISAIPHFEWKEEKQDNLSVLAERKTGYRMQSNLHVAVADEAAAQRAVDKAFEAGVTDIIAFDYGSDKLDKAKDQARETALKAAKAKSELLLRGLLKEDPTVVNLQEHTTVHYPESLYRAFTNADDQTVTSGWRDNLPRLHAHRPKNTYYRGLTQDADVQPQDLPMQAEITVVSTVRIYYASPAATKRKES